MIRLAQAHARLMCQETVQVRDAIVAIQLVETSLMSTCVDGMPSTLHTPFPDFPELEYRNQEQSFLERLDLMDLQSEPYKFPDAPLPSASQMDQAQVQALGNLPSSMTESRTDVPAFDLDFGLDLPESDSTVSSQSTSGSELPKITQEIPDSISTLQVPSLNVTPEPSGRFKLSQFRYQKR